MSEGISSGMYRKGLAESLKEIRNSGDTGKGKAHFFLEVAKETGLYQKAEAEQSEHRKKSHAMWEDRKGSGGSSAVDTDEQAVAEAFESKESQEAKIIQELLELTSSNENFSLGISANGSLYPGAGLARGQYGYLLDQSTQSLKERRGGYDPGADPMIYDRDGDMKTIYTPFLKASDVKTTDGRVLKYQGWINWENRFENEFTRETRNALNFAGTLFIRNTEETVRAVSKELYEVLCKPRTQETQSIMWKFFVDSFRKYVPEYWKYLEEQWQEQQGNEGKDIRSYFD